MAAKDYTLGVTGLTNSIWICKPSKTNKNLMLDDRAKVDENHFIGVVLEWAHNKIDANGDTLVLRSGGKVVAEIKIDRVALGLKPAKSDKASKKKQGVAKNN